jgi:hypothetical protein
VIRPYRFNKRAVHEPGSTVTWVIYTFITVIVMGTFILYVGSINVSGNFGLGSKIISPTEKAKVPSSSPYDLGVLQSFYYFLNSYTEVNGEKILVKDLVSGQPESDAVKFNKFKELANKYLSNYVYSESSGSKQGYVLKAWIRIYDFDETIQKISSNKMYKNYEIIKGIPIMGKNMDVICSPYTSSSSVFYYIVPKNQENLGKKVVLCVEYK